MDLNRKLDYAKQAIMSISRHDDEDAAVRSHFLSRLEAFIADERAQADKRVAQRIADLQFPKTLT